MFRLPVYFFHANVYNNKGEPVRYLSGSYELDSRFSDRQNIVEDLKNHMVADGKAPSMSKIEITQLNRL
jgi:hypothetical protein